MNETAREARVTSPHDTPPRNPVNVVVLAAVIAVTALLLWKLAAVLVALTVIPQTAILTAFMFWGAHFIEGTFITPLVQDESVDLPPVLTIFSTLAFTVVFGPSGVLLASPLALFIITAIQVFYLDCPPIDAG